MSILNILIIDDHPIIVNAYKNAINNLKSINQQHSFHITSIFDIDQAYQEIISTKKSKIDIIFLDIKLNKSKNDFLKSGEDLGLLIRKESPNTKIIVSTSYEDSYIINKILTNINPEGFLIKSEITTRDIEQVTENIINNIPYYSNTILKHLKNHIDRGYSFDKIDIQIMYELSIGTKMINLPDIIPMSIGGIERRKRKIKKIFNMLPKQGDKDMIRIAKEKNLI